MTPEGKVKAKLRKWMKENFPDAWHHAPRGGAFGDTGQPDDIWFWNGIFIAIESKADEYSKPTPRQLLHLKTIQRNKGIAAVLYGFELSKLLEIKNRAIRLASERGQKALPTSDHDN